MIQIIIDGELKTFTLDEYNKYLNKNRIDINSNKELVPDLDKIKINGIEFNNTSDLLTINTKTYVVEPERSYDGSIENIEDYDTFIVPRCDITFGYISLSNYRKLCNAILPNEFPVEYYDKQFGRKVRHYMYCTPNEMKKLYNLGINVLGVQDFTLSLIGTLNHRDSYVVTFDANGGEIENYKGEYNSTTTYYKNDKVKYGNYYYLANFNLTKFSGIPVSNTDYWENITINNYSNATEYNIGDFVVNENVYYKCIMANTGISPTNTNYWQVINIIEYSSDEEYSLGNIVLYENNYYKAIYEQVSIKDILPTNTDYWQIISELSPQELLWGEKIKLPTIRNLFSNTYSTTTWTAYFEDGTTANFMENQSVNIFGNTIFKPNWGN